MLAAEKSVFVFALGRERVEAEEGLLDEAGMTHDQATLRQPVEKLPHQRAEIPLLRPVVGAGAKLRAQRIDNQRLGRAQPPRQRLMASALAHPGVGRSRLHRLEKRVAHPGKQLRMLVAIDKIRSASE